MNTTTTSLSAVLLLAFHMLSTPLIASPDTVATGKTLLGKSVTSQEILVYRAASGDTVVTAGGGNSETRATYQTFRGDTVLVENNQIGGTRKVRVAFPGENGKDISLIRQDTVTKQDRGDFRGTATYKTFRGDTILMEEIKTGEKRKVRIIFPGVDGRKVSVESETRVIVADSSARDGEQARSRPEMKRDQTEDPKAKSPQSGSRDSGKRVASYRKAIFGITFSRIDLGFTRPMVGGSFAMEGENEILAYRPGKTFNFGFDIFQMGHRFNPNFRILLSGGFDWTYIRLKEGLEFDREASPYTFSADLPADFDQNRLTSTYLRVPLTFEVKSREKNGTRLAFGPIAGFLLKGTQRYKLDGGKTTVKRRGDYGFAPFQYGVFARVGLKNIGVYGKYYFNDMFENSPADAGLKNFTFGLTAIF